MLRLLVTCEGLLGILYQDLKKTWVSGVSFCGEFEQRKVESEDLHRYNHFNFDYMYVVVKL